MFGIPRSGNPTYSRQPISDIGLRDGFFFGNGGPVNELHSVAWWEYRLNKRRESVIVCLGKDSEISW